MNDDVANRIYAHLDSGEINFFLGAASTAPTDNPDWEAQEAYPSVRQLKRFLLRECGADKAKYRMDFTRTPTLAQVASYCQYLGRTRYENALNAAFINRDPRHRSPVAEMIAKSIERLRQRANRPRWFRYPVIITTNFDESVERSLCDREIPHVVLVAKSRRAGDRGLIEDRKQFISDDQYARAKNPVQECVHLIKVHGQIMQAPDSTDVTMTEGNYIDFITDVQLRELFCNHRTVEASIKSTHFLFLGYSLADWNVRAMLRTVFGKGDAGGIDRWAISTGFSEYQTTFLKNEYSIEYVNAKLELFSKEMAGLLERNP